MAVNIDEPKQVPIPKVKGKSGKKGAKDKKHKVEKKQAKGQVSIQAPGVPEEIVEIILSVREFTSPTANVGFSMGFTHNCGDYESVKMQVSVNLPCLSTEEELNATFEIGAEWVDKQLTQAKKAFFKANKHLKNGKKM